MRFCSARPTVSIRVQPPSHSFSDSFVNAITSLYTTALPFLSWITSPKVLCTIMLAVCIARFAVSVLRGFRVFDTTVELSIKGIATAFVLNGFIWILFNTFSTDNPILTWLLPATGLQTQPTELIQHPLDVKPTDGTTTRVVAGTSALITTLFACMFRRFRI